LLQYNPFATNTSTPRDTILIRLIQSIAFSVLFFISFCTLALDDEPLPDQPAVLNPVITKPGFHFVLNAGMTFGGDTVATATFKNGSSQTIKGGGMQQLGFGGLYQFDNSPIALLLSANVHFHYVTASNGNMIFRRVPVEVLAYYTGVERFRIGGGARFVNSAEASITIDGAAQKTTFDNATGYVAEVGYHIDTPVWVSFRYVSEKYQGNTYTSASGTKTSLAGTKAYDGTHAGVNLSFVF
jgi:hypothetical protein